MLVCRGEPYGITAHEHVGSEYTLLIRFWQPRGQIVWVYRCTRWPYSAKSSTILCA